MGERDLIISRLLQYQVPKSQAEIIADVMVTADEYGVTSHGVEILDSHIDRLNRGAYNLHPNFHIIRETAAFAVIDGDNAFGFVSGVYCMNYAIKKAKESGVFQVFSRNNNTLGPAFYYALKAAEHKMIGIVFTNSPAQMAPIGGKEKMLGTNPLSAVIPVLGKDPIIIDMATSVVAKSKFKQYKAEGKELPDGWALDANGCPTNDPDEGIRGFVQPMAGFKGYSISMLIDIISGVLSGAAYLNKVGQFYGSDECMNVGYYMVAIEPKIVFGENFYDVMSDYVKTLRGSKTIFGEKISLPGDDRIAYKNKKK